MRETLAPNSLVRVDFLFDLFCLFDAFLGLVCAKKWTLELNGFIVIVRFTYRNDKISIAHGV